MYAFPSHNVSYSVSGCLFDHLSPPVDDKLHTKGMFASTAYFLVSLSPNPILISSPTSSLSCFKSHLSWCFLCEHYLPPVLFGSKKRKANAWRKPIRGWGYIILPNKKIKNHSQHYIPNAQKQLLSLSINFSAGLVLSLPADGGNQNTIDPITFLQSTAKNISEVNTHKTFLKSFYFHQDLLKLLPCRNIKVGVQRCPFHTPANRLNQSTKEWLLLLK